MTTGAARQPPAGRSRWPNRFARAGGAPTTGSQPSPGIRPGQRRWQPDLCWRSALALMRPLLIMGVLFLIYLIIRLVIVAFGPPSGEGSFSASFRKWSIGERTRPVMASFVASEALYAQ
jgi:hypothetical protein